MRDIDQGLVELVLPAIVHRALQPLPLVPDPHTAKHKMNSLRRYLALYAALWKNSVVREMGFKVNFLLWIVVDLLWFALQVTFIAVIYRHTERIGDWPQGGV